jgi:hypothetical protein
MTSPRRIAVVLAVCGLAGLVPAGTVVAAPNPSPGELWEMYPLDPAGSGARERPRGAVTRAQTRTAQTPTATAPTATAATTTTATTTTATTGVAVTTARETEPSGAVAGVSTTQRPPATAADAGAGDAGGSAVLTGLIFGVAAAGMILLALAALPPAATPERIADLVAARRIDMTLAGTFILIAAAIVYIASVQ